MLEIFRFPEIDKIDINVRCIQQNALLYEKQYTSVLDFIHRFKIRFTESMPQLLKRNPIPATDVIDNCE